MDSVASAFERSGLSKVLFEPFDSLGISDSGTQARKIIDQKSIDLKGVDEKA